MTLDELKEWRAAGVRRASWLDGKLIHVEFMPPEPRADSPIVPATFTQNAPVTGEDVCACGHILPAHNPDGLCLLGCDVEKCAKTPKG